MDDILDNENSSDVVVAKILASSFMIVRQAETLALHCFGCSDGVYVMVALVMILKLLEDCIVTPDSCARSLMVHARTLYRLSMVDWVALESEVLRKCENRLDLFV